MRAVVYREPFQVAVADVPDPRVEHPQDAIVRVSSTSICGSDLHVYEGRTSVRPGTVLGHENMGTVVDRGSAVSRVQLGDRVSVPCTVSCGTCANCERGRTEFCLRTNPDPHRAGAAYGCPDMGPYPGGQAEYLRVPFADFNLLRLPPGDDQELDFATLSDVFPTGFHGTELADVQAGNTVVVFGAGPVGLLAAYSAALCGAGTVLVVDPVPSRLRLCERIGATGIDSSTEDVAERVREETRDRGADCGIDAVGYQARTASGEEQAGLVLNQLVDCVRWTGSIGVLGVYPTRDPGAADESGARGRLPFDMGAFFAKGLRMGSGPANVKRYNRFLRDLIITGRAQPSCVMSHQLPLADAPDAYARFDHRDEGWIKITLQP